MKKLFLLLISLCAASFCQAQEELPTVVPDRPGNTYGVDVTPLHKLIWDNGIGFESSPGGAQTITLNTTILRYGIFENMELRVGTDFLMNKNDAAMKPTFGINPLYFGTKLKVYEGTGILPSIGLLAELKSPHVGSKELLPAHLAPSMYVLFEHNITNWLGIGYNIGEKWDGKSATPATFLALSLNFSINDKLGAFVETYNNLHPEDENEYMTEFGFTWLVSRRVQLDIEGDLDLKNIGKHYSLGCGISWMIN